MKKQIARTTGRLIVMEKHHGHAKSHVRGVFGYTKNK